MVTIRKARPEDASQLHRMIGDLARFEKEEHSVKLTAEDLASAMRLPQPPFQCLLAEIDGRACGFALYFFAFSTWEGRTIYLEDLFVYPEYRGEGIGAQIMTHLAEIATSENCKRFEWSVLNWNQPAIGFYERLGARPLAEWTRFRMDTPSMKALLTHT